MSDPITTPPPEPKKPQRGISPALLIFVVFPLAGLLAALAVILTNQQATLAPVTPMPVTVPPAATRPALNGEPAPDITLRTLDETTVSLSDYQGRMVFLNFWATWCVPCERELPAFQAFMQEQGDDGAVVLAVNLGETYDTVDAYLDELGVGGFPVLLDVDYEASDLYGIGPIPVTFVIDQEGVIRAAKYGEMTSEDLIDYLANL